MGEYDDDDIAVLVGKTVRRIFMDAGHLVFETDHGPYACEVYGDCCSHSYFYDFLGVRHLLDNGPIVAVDTIDMADPDDEDARSGDVVRAYGYRFTTEHSTFGPVSSVVSFRNDSNGYYGGWMEIGPTTATSRPVHELTDDCLGLPGEA